MGKDRECASAALPIQTPEPLDGNTVITIEQIAPVASPFDDKMAFTALGADDRRGKILIGNTAGGQ